MKKLMIFIFILLAITLSGCGGDDGGTKPPPPPTPPIRLVVDTTVTAPTLSGVDEAVWSLIDSVNVEVGGVPSKYGFDDGIGKINVVMKAIKISDTLYIRARWRDNTASIWGNAIKKSQYAYAWEHVTYDGGEDELMLLFDAGDNGTEKADCATMCHATSMSTTGGGHADCWKWKSTTTYPGKMGEDEYWSSTGRELDATVNDYVYRGNWDGNASTPDFMHVDTFAFTGPFLYVDDTTDMNNLLNWPSDPGYVMPGYFIDSTIYKSPTRTNNSRWDIRAVAKYDSTAGGTPYYWTVVMARALNTTHTADDADLSGVDSVQVTMAISDAFMKDDLVPGATVHSGSKPFYIILKP
jgi:hypothetical protein